MEENQTTQAEKATFDQVLQDPDYRRAFDDRVRAAVGRRFRTVDAQRQEMRALAGDMARRLGVAPGEDGQVDLDALRAAMAAQDEPAPAEEDAPDEAPDDGEEPIRRSFRAAVAEGEALRQLYPGFDLGRELSDPRFAEMLVSLQRAGAAEPVRLAYEGVHHREILGGVVRYAVARTAAQVAEGVRSGALRPAENGGGAASDSRLDPRTLSDRQRRDIRARVMRGERVTF